MRYPVVNVKTIRQIAQIFVAFSEKLNFNRMFFNVPGGFSDLKNQNNYNSNWKKILGFRNLQEKLENIISRKNRIKI